MKYFKRLLFVVSGLLLASCIKHEIIPPPSEEVVLPASFMASLQGADYELIKDVDGYYCEGTEQKELNPAPQPSNVIYYSNIRSQSKLDFIQVGIGKLNFNSDNTSTPSMESFVKFFREDIGANVEVPFSNGALEGVEIVYRDGNEKIWKSTELSPGSFQFLKLREASDPNGDYMIFTAKFTVLLQEDVEEPEEYLTIENAIFEGFFKR